MFFKDSKTLNITQFGALAGQKQHMVARKVSFTPRLMRQVALPSTFQAQLCYIDFNAAELKTCQLGPPASAAAAWTLLFEQPYATSDQPAHQTQWFLVFWSPYIKKKNCKRNGAKRLSSWRDMQINVPFPLESTHLGYRCTRCAFSPVILYAVRLV